MFSMDILPKFSMLLLIKEFAFLVPEDSAGTEIFIPRSLYQNWFKYYISVKSKVFLNWISICFPSFTNSIPPITMIWAV